MSDMTTLTGNAPAKVNLYLEVSAKRADGYHDIESVMQTVTLFDTVTLWRRPDDGHGIILKCDRGGVPLDEKNLVYRAARLFFEKMNIAERDVTFFLEKRIPMAAGLGGGSSEAATALTLLNEMYETALSEDDLCALGAKIGADVPFLIKQGISVTRGIGDEFLPCERMPDCFIVLACAGQGVSTPWAYARLDEMYDFSARNVSTERFTDALCCGDISLIASQMTNIFESVVLCEHNEAKKIKQTLEKSGAVKAMMSGSGPSVFGIFTDYGAAADAANALEEQGIQAFLTKSYYPAS